jgi:hypothetical protein
VSVVVPVLDEAAALPALLDHLDALPGRFEVIVADGGSTDATRAIAAERGARVVDAPRGRAAQQNAGGAAARGDVLVFLHADSRLPAGAHASLVGALRDPRVAGGNFALRFDGDDASAGCSAPGTRCSGARGSSTATRRSGCGPRCSGRSAASRRCRSWRTTRSCARCRRRTDARAWAGGASRDDVVAALARIGRPANRRVVGADPLALPRGRAGRPARTALQSNSLINLFSPTSCNLAELGQG